MTASNQQRSALNGVCPYFTMFPLDFPYGVLSRYAGVGDQVLDPFCGRGTTNFAARLLGLPSVGIDSGRVAVAIAQAKLANTSSRSINRVALRVLDEVEIPRDVPAGEFWEWAYHPEVLKMICRLREGLLGNCRSDARRALRAVVLGALHGPRPKSRPAYFSNQSQRTYAPKPRYAVKFWKARSLVPERVDVLGIIAERARRYFSAEVPTAVGRIVRADSRSVSVYSRLRGPHQFNWIITSPPYYGMRTYIPDQWLRAWFLGGPSLVDYSQEGQMMHSSPDSFSSQLGQVWRNVGSVCAPEAQLVVRFGGINDRRASPTDILLASLADSGWEVQRSEPAGSASTGRRQALHFARCINRAIGEFDVWAVWRS